VPELCRFLGIVIAMYYREHGPPHFHAVYGEFEVTIGIGDGSVSGRFPRRALGLVLEWAELHRAELAENWERAGHRQALRQIAPLE
jgi:hypothetical protein